VYAVQPGAVCASTNSTWPSCLVALQLTANYLVTNVQGRLPIVLSTRRELYVWVAQVKQPTFVYLLFLVSAELIHTFIVCDNVVHCTLASYNLSVQVACFKLMFDVVSVTYNTLMAQ
jgi:hypothetical protein